MILTKQIEIKLRNNDIFYYENKGYIIPRYIDKQGILKVKKGTTILVKVEDLQKGSHNKVLCKCDICKKERWLYYNQYRDICKKCTRLLQIGDKSPNFGNHKMSGIKHFQYNKPRTEEVKIKISNSLKGRYIGEKNPNWNDNLTKEERYLSKNRRLYPDYYIWTILVYKRDNYTCQCCGSKEKICAHHINNFADFKELRTDIDNGITLCENCHKELHKLFGIKSIEEHLNKYLDKS